MAVCVHVGCVYSNISWNWFLAPYLSAVVRAFPLAQAPQHACFALAAAPLQICTEHRHKRAACSHWTRGNKHATCISCSRRLCSVFFINCEVFVFLMIVFVWIWTSLVLAVSQDSYPVPRLSCIGNIIWKCHFLYSSSPNLAFGNQRIRRLNGRLAENIRDYGKYELLVVRMAYILQVFWGHRMACVWETACQQPLALAKWAVLFCWRKIGKPRIKCEWNWLIFFCYCGWEIAPV